MARARISTGLFVPPTEPRTQKAVRTRRLLLELASQLFVERGYNAVSIQEITDAAQLTTGAFYGHFPSKGHLLVEVVRFKMAEADEQMAAVVDIDSGADLLYATERADLRLLEVDAAAAARHDPAVADGLRALYEIRGSLIEQTARAGPVENAGDNLPSSLPNMSSDRRRWPPGPFEPQIESFASAGVLGSVACARRSRRAAPSVSGHRRSIRRAAPRRGHPVSPCDSGRRAKG